MKSRGVCKSDTHHLAGDSSGGSEQGCPEGEREQGSNSYLFCPCGAGSSSPPSCPCLLAPSTPVLVPPTVDLPELACARGHSELSTMALLKVLPRPASEASVSMFSYLKCFLAWHPSTCSLVDIDKRSTSPSKCVARTRKGNPDLVLEENIQC